MRVVAVSNLVDYVQQAAHGDAEGPIRAWLDVVKLAKWTAPSDVKAQFGNASIIANNRIVFNIAGNKYRLIVAVAYRTQWMFVKFIGTHAAYDRVDAATVDQFK
ncbi:MAG: type II toxin-antitoxin system HigB family toxin [Gammaproteobacteria bacterium]|nr:type II toxin-antitoxin system HigB family toxin [Gammaproteobacteria bacterium]MBU1444215.1 type II toxin-antitoxin system HigB family toxin [Gammaproteobacteria bacterium]MBU2286287.1 type II toxin-antitoxin system HigB family toxin [Gammaproteobacteria bacterium]MBU2410019.1 type II toxin-antitoxin system HigB family toxin [Gammaproteobacteria bacterium]